MGKTKSIGNLKLVATGIVLTAMIMAGVLLIRPAQIRASTGDEPQLFLEADVGSTYLPGQTISLSATADGGEIFDGPIYSPDQSFEGIASEYQCSALAGIDYEDERGRPVRGYFEAHLTLTRIETTPTPLTTATPIPTATPIYWARITASTSHTEAYPGTEITLNATYETNAEDYAIHWSPVIIGGMGAQHTVKIRGLEDKEYTAKIAIKPPEGQWHIADEDSVGVSVIDCPDDVQELSISTDQLPNLEKAAEQLGAQASSSGGLSGSRWKEYDPSSQECISCYEIGGNVRVGISGSFEKTKWFLIPKPPGAWIKATIGAEPSINGSMEASIVKSPAGLNGTGSGTIDGTITVTGNVTVAWILPIIIGGSATGSGEGGAEGSIEVTGTTIGVTGGISEVVAAIEGEVTIVGFKVYKFDEEVNLLDDPPSFEGTWDLSEYLN